MDKQTLTGETRTPVKNRKGENGRLRRAGRIPAIIYGIKKPVEISINEKEFNQKFRVISENIIITITVGRDTYDVLVKDYQEDLLEDKIMHLDFYAIDPERMLRTHIPVYLSGNPKGVKEGGILEHVLHEVEVECLPKNMPDRIELDTSELAIHQSIYIRDIAALEGVRFLNSPDYVVCHVVAKAAEIEEAPKEEAVAAAVPAEGGEQPAAAAAPAGKAEKSEE
jgi:large subunit ribosomal protein L25